MVNLNRIWKDSVDIVGISLRAFILYGGLCLVANSLVTGFPGKKLDYEQVTNIIDNKLEKSSFEDKKINLIQLESNSFSESMIKGFAYSSQGEHYIALDSEGMNKNYFFHELGHVKLRSARKDSTSIEDCLKIINSYGEKGISVKELTKYFLSPEELFCNIYALSHGSKSFE